MKTFIIIQTILLVFLMGCSSNKEKPSSTLEITNSVTISADEAKNIDIKTGTIASKNISQTIQASGFLDVPPNSKVSVTAPMQGVVKSTNVLQGSWVKKGETIAELQHQDYIQLQQDYLDYKSQLQYLAAENERQQQLSAENINAKKTAQQAQSVYQSMQAKVSGTEAKLRLMGINPQTISSKTLQQSISIKAPISGYVTQVNVNLGSYVNPMDILFVIVNTEHLHAELTVFEKDIYLIKVEQKVLFTIGNEKTPRSARVHLIGREIKADRSVQIHCHLDKEDGTLIPGMYLKAVIETNNKLTKALPETAIIRYEDINYVFVEKKKGTYELVQVKIGDNENGFVSILEPIPFDSTNKVVIEGGNFLMGKLKNAEE